VVLPISLVPVVPVVSMVVTTLRATATTTMAGGGTAAGDVMAPMPTTTMAMPTAATTPAKYSYRRHAYSRVLVCH
jgi:hypothetical protein